MDDDISDLYDAIMQQDDDYLEPIPDELIDSTPYFKFDRTFKDRDELIFETRKVGLLHGIKVCLLAHHPLRGFGHQWFKCDRSGPYQCRSKLDLQSSRSFTGTKKRGCPFRLKGFGRFDGTWMLNVINGMHNHEIGVSIEHDGLNHEVKEMVLRMTASKISVANILIDLASKGIFLTAKQVYNIRAKKKHKTRENRSSVEQLLKLATDHNYRVFHQTIPAQTKGTKELTDVLFAHPESLNLLKYYPFVLLADSTYNTNKHKMPLLQVIGITPVKMNFSVFFAFLYNEKETAYDWALKCMTEILDPHRNIIFVTDRDKALMNAIEKHFPNATHLLCRRHIQKDVEAWVKKTMRRGDIGETFAKGRWTRLVRSSSTEEFSENYKFMLQKYSFVPGLENYLNDTWLVPYKEKFVSVWTNKVMHFGNTTTNRVEGAHASLKRLLRTSVGGLDTVFETINHSVNLQIREIVRELGRSKTIGLHISKAMVVYQRLTYHVSHHAIKTLERALHKNDCFNCAMKTTHGLPCACDIIDLVNKDDVIDLNFVHEFWKTLDIGVKFEKDIYDREIQQTSRLRTLVDVLFKSGPDMMQKVCEYIESMLHPHNIVDPEVKKTRGRPKKTSVSRDPSQWEHIEKMFPNTGSKRPIPQDSANEPTISTSPLKQEKPTTSRKRPRTQGAKKSTLSQASKTKKQSIPSQHDKHVQGEISSLPFKYSRDVPAIIMPSITSWLDVEGDGNCGFRAVAREMYGDQSEWKKVRHDLLDELNCNKDYYNDYLGGIKGVDSLALRISHWDGPAPRGKWFDADLGLVAANKYDAVFVLMSTVQNYTYTPIKPAKNVVKDGPEKVIALVLIVACEHFVWVNLEAESALPPLHPFCDPYKKNRRRKNKAKGTQDSQDCLDIELCNNL